MANEEAKKTAELDALFRALAEPFDPAEIKWRVTHTNREGTRGAVIAYADPRAYTDRLNQLFTPTGWTRSFEVSTLSAITRMKRDKLIHTGKVLVTCTLTIAGLGTQSDCGEEWADEENAMTSAQAQAFKRAASCYGLGRYLYNFREMWVSLDDHKQPIQIPALPKWALPAGKAAASAQPASGPKPAAVHRGPIDQNLTAEIEGFRGALGEPIYREILYLMAKVERARDIPNAQLQQQIVHWMERALRGIEKVRTLAEQVGETRFTTVMHRLQVNPKAPLPDLETLRILAAELDSEAARTAA
jgi:hypothetical protein